MKITHTGRRTCALALIAGSLLAAPAARADVFDDIIVGAGLTGGDNTIKILQVKEPGSVTVTRVAGKPAELSEFKAPLTAAEMRCKRDGYRCKWMGMDDEDNVTSEFSRTRSEEQGDAAALPSKRSEAQVRALLDTACREKKQTALVPVYVRGKCMKVKLAIGPKHIAVESPVARAPVTLTCVGY